MRLSLPNATYCLLQIAIVVAIAASAAIVLGQTHDAAQEAALAPLRKHLLGVVVWDQHGNVSRIYFSTDSSARDGDLQNLVHFPELRGLRLSGTRFSEAGLAVLARLTKLEDLYVSKHPELPNANEVSGIRADGSWEIGDAGLSHVRGLTSLRQLGYWGSVSDAGFEHLQELRALEGLHLGCPKATDRALTCLRNLTCLDVLALNNGNAMTGQGLSAIANPARLRSLSMLFVTDAGMRTITRFSNLQDLAIGGPDITADGFQQLGTLKCLAKLKISKAPLDNALLEEYVAQLAWLRELRILRCRISGDGLKALRGLKDLTALAVRSEGIDDKSVPYLAEFPNLRVLNLDGTAITNASIPALLALRKLEELSVPLSMGATPELRKELSKALPNLRYFKSSEGEIRLSGREKVDK